MAENSFSGHDAGVTLGWEVKLAVAKLHSGTGGQRNFAKLSRLAIAKLPASYVHVTDVGREIG